MVDTALAGGLQAALWPVRRSHQAAIATSLPVADVSDMADVEDGEEPCALSSHSGSAGSKSGGDKMFSLKKWNAVAMWSWDVECDTCAICRVQVMDACLRCQAENKQEDCVGRQRMELRRNWGPPLHPGPRTVMESPLSTDFTCWSGENVIIPFTTAACPCG